jgi:hypothetical protein
MMIKQSSVTKEDQELLKLFQKIKTRDIESKLEKSKSVLGLKEVYTNGINLLAYYLHNAKEDETKLVCIELNVVKII